MATATATQTAFAPGRFAGLGGVAFAVIVGAENIALPQPPEFDASGEEVLRWIHDHHALVATMVASFAITAVCLATFIGGFLVRAFREEHEDARVFAVIGAFGAVLIGAWFALVIISQLLLLGLDGSANATPATAELVWHLHTAAFTVNVVAIGIAVFGVAGAAVRMGLAPSWYRPLSFVALAAAMATTMQSSSAINGGSGWQIGLISFVSWLLLLAIVGVRMARTPA
jgi:hypothetical protein